MAMHSKGIPGLFAAATYDAFLKGILERTMGAINWLWSHTLRIRSLTMEDKVVYSIHLLLIIRCLSARLLYIIKDVDVWIVLIVTCII